MKVSTEIIGHSTDEQSRRYPHLFPDVKQQEVLNVFGKA